MERKRFSVLFFIKRTKLLKNGDAPVRVRITYDKIYVEIQLKRSIKASLWSQEKERAIGKDRNSVEINHYIDGLRVKFYQIYQDLEMEGKLMSARAIVNRYLGKDDSTKTLYNVFKEHNDNCRKLIGTDYVEITIRRYDNCLKYLMEIVKQEYKVDDMLLREVNGELVRKFDLYLKTEKGCAQNTVIRYMKCFKKVINLAIANEWITKNPFAGIKFHEIEVNREFLTQTELNKIIAKEFEIERLALVRDVFVFQAYTGLAFIDVYNLRPEHLTEDNNGNLWIMKTREKTNNMCNIPLLSIPKQILEKYKDDPHCQKKGVLLPVPCNQKLNSYLKEIADLCGIKKRLSSHSARYTFASVITLANNVSLSNVAKMLGHSFTRMTQHYAKVMNQSILKEMQEVENRLPS
jgi:site-specific recombinase XerD